MSHATLFRLKRQAQRYGITQDAIAAAAGVGRTLVSHVFAGRARSSNVVTTARRLVGARRTTQEDATSALRSPSRRENARRRRSAAKTLLKHATGWAGGDLEKRLTEVYALRSRARA